MVIMLGFSRAVIQSFLLSLRLFLLEWQHSAYVILYAISVLIEWLTAQSFSWASEETLDSRTTLRLLRLQQFLKIDMMQLASRDARKPLGPVVEYYGLTLKCPHRLRL